MKISNMLYKLSRSFGKKAGQIKDLEVLAQGPDKFLKRKIKKTINKKLYKTQRKIMKKLFK